MKSCGSSQVGGIYLLPAWPPYAPISIDIAIGECRTILKVTNNVTNNHKIRPHLLAKIILLTGSKSKHCSCRTEFLHVDSRSLDHRLLATVCRALVLTATATLHSGGETGASRSRLSLEHRICTAT